ncbi:type VI secretion system tip protein VgrG [Klebsiella quasipneumoniae]|uniref:type VI secretion system Vgr family protein n=1 Tax=Klebsiella quasipneumoniae TaxID=1463165 RepID=UPI002ABA1501|nr:type VI secretion system tip protein VgrG [Klebsiella quasipneumoniae]MDZ1776424.1 type VI secretion system tip protein VgrG [Klebsiella quasipneumoniae]
MDTSSIITGTTLNRYQLDIPSCTASLDVEEFSGAEKLSELYYYTITFTSAEKNIDAAQLLSKPAMLTMGGGALQQLADCKRVHGVVTAFRRISSSEDQSKYQITLEPFLSLLDKQFRSHRFFVNKSVPEVVEQVLQEHHLHDWEYEFNLKQHYPRREQINQYQESDLAFIQRLLAEVGIFYFFTLQEEAQSEVVHFSDAQRALMFDKTLPVNSPSGMSDSGTESIWGLNITHNVVEANVTTRDYNPRDAQSVLQSATADMTRGNGEGITYGEVYHYKLRHRERGDKIDPQTETANFYARLDHERFLAHQTLITAISTAAWLAPAQVLTVTDSLPSTLPAPVQDPLLIIGTGFTASRREALRVSLLAVPYSETLCWRPPLLPRPNVTGTMITVTSVEGRVEITAAEELVVNCAGAYIRLSGGNIELGCPGNILLKSANVQKMGKADFRVPPLELPKGFEERFTVKDQKTGEIVPFARYRITTEKGQVFEGRADADGKTASVYTALPESIKIELL